MGIHAHHVNVIHVFIIHSIYNPNPEGIYFFSNDESLYYHMINLYHFWTGLFISYFYQYFVSSELSNVSLLLPTRIILLPTQFLPPW